MDQQADYERAHTVGHWDTEAGSAAALDAILEQAGLWTVYREVPGALSQPRPSQAGKALRIDRVLVPGGKLIKLGWAHGNIGIEIKRSGMKIGEPIAQAMDYSRAVWTLPQGGIKIWLDWVFIWPAPKQYGTIGSILAQNRIGCAYTSERAPLTLHNSGEHLLEIGRDGEIRIGAGRNGQKAGSR